MTEAVRAPSRALRRPDLFWLAGVLLLTWIAYLPSLDNGLTNWDDGDYVSSNPYLRELSWANTEQIFTSYYKGNYHPLTMLSLSLDHRLGGDDPRIHHLVNLLLHLANTALVFLCMRGLRQRSEIALLVAALFGVHPMHVESVAWISERKDVLHAFFYLASLLAYLRYCDASGRERVRAHALALTLFLLALLSKGTAVALVPSLVAVDHLLGRRAFAPRSLLEKLPWLLLALPFGLLAVRAQTSVGQLIGVSQWTLVERVVLACHGFVQYLVLLIAPHSLSAFYPYPERVSGALPWHYWLDAGYVLALLAVLGWSWRRRPLLAFSIAFFTLNIALVLQLIPIGGAIMADRYSYLPSIGLFLALSAGGLRLAEHAPAARRLVALACALYLGAFAFATSQRCLVWRDSLSLWDDTLAQYPAIPSARLNRALARFEHGDLAGADSDLSEAIRISPGFAQAHAHRGVIRYQAGDSEAALLDLDRAVTLAPSADTLANRGAVRLASGNLPGALADLDRTLALNPRHALAYANRGLAHAALGRHEAALLDLRAAIALSPGYVPAHVGSGEARRSLGDAQGALIDFENALALAPDHAPALLGRGRVAIALGEWQSGCANLRDAARLGAEEAVSELERHCAQRSRER